MEHTIPFTFPPLVQTDGLSWKFLHVMPVGITYIVTWIAVESLAYTKQWAL